ncbi:XrtN system VIT domain-containing protein [Chitinophaga pinensis]|uniref:XrtN system VIT domain-containing protein n=1 Tax=Chitinophaga pinensis TaxID=79329 RepID=A0A5C6LP46_9BACT|nr:XrtN system VIT domain-containing protein [Chitinophaga pinensis]TWV97372.1 XrtN system VIT domain-containing protein [Chitinophaga pinensis]
MNGRSIPLRILDTRLRDNMYNFGLVILVLTLIFFCIGEVIPPKGESEYMGWFFANYFFTCVYFAALLSSGRLRKRRDGLPLMILFLLIFLVSAYSLNRFISVFAESANWFAVTILLCSANYIAFAYLRFLPVWTRLCMFFLLGLSFCCFLYMAVYIFPISLFGLAGFFLFGIPLHAILPLLFCLYTIRVWRRNRQQRRSYDIAFLSGIGATVLFVAVYALLWRVSVVEVEKQYESSAINNDLPKWVNLVSKVSTGPVTQKVLVADAGYTVPDTWGESSFFLRGGRRQVLHDPLVMISACLGGTADIPWEDRAAILETFYDDQPDKELHLWSDEDLVTSHVQTATQIWPALRLAYTEKTINVKNKGAQNRFNQQEAIYRFQLPEGALVSSLSLWINGKEEKGILTTKTKADSAYTSIVGQERRDPSVVHWREGNMIAVRVFPVLGGEERQFKIGITAPLSLEHGQLIYRNIPFKGPSAISAGEKVDVQFETLPSDLHYSAAFSREEKNTLVNIGGYREEWMLSMKDEGLVHQVFSNKDMMYTAVPYKKELGNADIKAVYLDINSSWTTAAFNKVYTLLNNYRVWVYVDDKLKEMTVLNRDELFTQLSAQRFSLFPFHKITDPDKALVITSSVVKSPRFDDLGDCIFTSDLKEWLGPSHRVMLFNMGGALSPYLRTLKECRAFRYDQGEVNDLQSLLQNKRFPLDIENDQRVVIEAADMAITVHPGAGGTTAPDHLQRLFAYNHIMQAMGPHLLTGGETADTLVAEAQEAHIVTPLSSLIVLETQADYDRFNIKDSNGSLKNAAIQNKGAVPEPHEWVLIIMAVLLLIGLKYRSVFSKRFNWING